MNRNLSKLIVACGTACFIACTAPQKAETEKWSERMARSEMKRFPEPLINEKANLNKLVVTDTYIYDLPTKAGQEYILTGK